MLLTMIECKTWVDEAPIKLAAAVPAIVACQSGLRQEEGGLVCVGCQLMFPRVPGVVRFVDQQFYRGSSGFQWLMHGARQ